MPRISTSSVSTAKIGSNSKKDLNVESGRVKGTTITFPIIYGNMARYFERKREDDGHTHQWTLYVKPYENCDMSRFIKKVHFKLHDSYAEPHRVVTCPPYEVSETGWGEFEATIRIYFEDSAEKPVVVYHVLKLFKAVPEIQSGKKPLVVEYYDELVFQDPTVQMYELLENIPRPLTQQQYEHDTDFEARKTHCNRSIQDAHSRVRREIVTVREKLKEARDLVQTFRAKIASVDDDDMAE